MKTAYDFVKNCCVKPGNDHFIIHYKVLGLQNKIAEKIILHSNKKTIYESVLNSKFNSYNSLEFSISKIVKEPWYLIATMECLDIVTDRRYQKVSNVEWIFKRSKADCFLKTEEKAIVILENVLKNENSGYHFDRLSGDFTKIIKTKSFYDYVASCYVNSDLYLSWKVAKRLTTKKFEKDLLSLIFSVKNIEDGAKGKLIAEFIKRNKIENMDSLIEELQKNKDKATKK